MVSPCCTISPTRTATRDWCALIVEMPLPWLIVVCADVHDASSYRAFTANGQQGINYARNAWHHPLLVLDSDSRFLIVDRKGPGNNLEEVQRDGDAAFNLVT